MPIWNIIGPRGKTTTMMWNRPYLIPEPLRADAETPRSRSEWMQDLRTDIKLQLKSVMPNYDMRWLNLAGHPEPMLILVAAMADAGGPIRRRYCNYFITPPMTRFFDQAVDPAYDPDVSGARFILIQPEIFDETGILFQSLKDKGNPAELLSVDLRDPEVRKVLGNHPEMMVALDSFLQTRRADPRFLPPG